MSNDFMSRKLRCVVEGTTVIQDECYGFPGAYITGTYEETFRRSMDLMGELP
jgi:hypothetical protein